MCPPKFNNLLTDTTMLGVLGGMGPLATADFYEKLIALTSAACDQEHVPVLIYAVPQVPDRTAALVNGGASPLPALLAGLRTLTAAGAQAIAIPCNTAHAWYDELAAASPVPILHIADAAADAAARIAGPGARLALVATSGTLAAGVYPRRFAARGFDCATPTDAEMRDLVMPGIGRVKAGAVDEGGRLLERAVGALLERGAGAVVLGCTEVPVALDRIASPLRAQCVDATAALATACVAWWGRTRRPEPAGPGLDKPLRTA
jgi:aspartate racemase